MMEVYGQRAQSSMLASVNVLTPALVTAAAQNSATEETPDGGLAAMLGSICLHGIAVAMQIINKEIHLLDYPHQNQHSGVHQRWARL